MTAHYALIMHFDPILTFRDRTEVHDQLTGESQAVRQKRLTA
jgi:hypothetical protein